jgi:RimJ/RimL family protein N-acetyltransferase
MSRQVEIERSFRGNPGDGSDLEFRPIKTSDVPLLTPVFKKHGNALRDFLRDYEWSSTWDFKTAATFVNDAWSAEFPNFTYLFLKGKQVVGLGQLGSHNGSLYDVQIVLWVNPDHQGHGYGRRIGATLMKVALEIWGFNSFSWIVAEENIPSIKTAENLGIPLADSWTGGEAHARKETGNWRVYTQYRDTSLPGGILQGEQSLQYWTGNSNASVLDEILKAAKDGDREKAQALGRAELDRINGNERPKEDDRNPFQKAIDMRGLELKQLGQKILNRHGRMAYNEELRRKRKKK